MVSHPKVPSYLGEIVIFGLSLVHKNARRATKVPQN